MVTFSTLPPGGEYRYCNSNVPLRSRLRGRFSLDQEAFVLKSSIFCTCNLQVKRPISRNQFVYVLCCVCDRPCSQTRYIRGTRDHLLGVSIRCFFHGPSAKRKDTHYEGSAFPFDGARCHGNRMSVHVPGLIPHPCKHCRIGPPESIPVTTALYAAVPRDFDLPPGKSTSPNMIQASFTLH